MSWSGFYVIWLAVPLLELISQEEVDEAQKVVDIIMELDEKLNMYDLSVNTSSDIENLSEEAQYFYSLYHEKSEQTNCFDRNHLLRSKHHLDLNFQLQTQQTK